MGSVNKQISRFEVTAVYTHPQATADIVLVHGLNGHPEKTWTAANSVFWPTDLLPASLELKNQHANVLVYGYNADVYSRGTNTPSNNFIHQHAQSLVTSLTSFRKSEGTERLPIIWVVHSLGGIVTKRALLYSNDIRAHQQEDLRSVFVSTYAIIFLGTPHQGSDLATWGRMLQAMSDAVIPRRFFETESVLLKSLKKDNETLQGINNHFLDIYQRFKIHMVHENHTTDLRGTRALVVDANSASPQLQGVIYYGIEATHSGMCKFDGQNAPGYRNVSTAITEWVAVARAVIDIRWEAEEEERKKRAADEYYERSVQAMQSYQRSHSPGYSNQQFPSIDNYSNETLLLQHRPHGNQRRPKLLTPLPSSPSPSTLSTREPTLVLEPGVITPSQPVDGNNDEPITTTTTNIQPQPQLPAPLTPPQPNSPAAQTHRHSQTQTSSLEQAEPLFIHPDSFRPNSFFVGREDELRGLHEMLQDRRRRLEGTSAVLIQCLPGGGKTHLAREYVYRYRDHYPGGVYWVRAKSRGEVESGYWRVARMEIMRSSTTTDATSNNHVTSLGLGLEALREDAKTMVQVVKAWFNSHRDWLLVLDGIQFDIPGLSDFIPDARHTSIIYTSTERAVTGDPRFDNPQVMELGLLTPRQAVELLLTELDRKPTVSTSSANNTGYNGNDRKHGGWKDEEEEKRALELVNLMGRLPLMIHVAAQHLKATREPLARYLAGWRASKPKQVGNLHAYKKVREQLDARGNVAALNLVGVLVWWEQLVPVEMVVFGLSALSRDAPVKTCDASHRKTTLNNTLKVLIKFALIERTTESHDSITPLTRSASTVSSRTSANRSLDTPGTNQHRNYSDSSDSLDLLRIHSVIQAFFIETLAEEKTAVAWIERAAAVWCRSFDEAHRRIEASRREVGEEHAKFEGPRVGVPDDYRRYCIHGQKLLQNIERFGNEKRDPQRRLEKWRWMVRQRVEEAGRGVEELSRLERLMGVEDVEVVSVFDGNNSGSQEGSSMSETDSNDTTAPSQESQEEGHVGPGSWERAFGGVAVDEGFTPMESPSSYHFSTASGRRRPSNLTMTIAGQAASGPFSWRERGMEATAPYPTEGVMPPTPGLDNKIRGLREDERTVAPAAVSAYYEPVDEHSHDEVDQAALTPIVETPSVYTALDGLEIPTPALETGLFEEWNAVVPNHRVIKKQEARRYHDRAGAWRDVKTVGDPRVGVTLDVAVGSLAGKPATGASTSVVPVWPPRRTRRVTAQTQSEAQLELNKIRQKVAGTQAVIAQAQAQAQAVTDGGLGGFGDSLTPPMPPRKMSGGGLSAVSDLSPPTPSSSGLLSPGGWLKRLREGFGSSVQSVPTAVGSTSPGMPQGQQLSRSAPQEDELMIVPGPIFRGSRTSRSSPADLISSPFPPPSFAATADLDESLVRPSQAAHRFSEPSSQVDWNQDADYLSSSQPAGPLPQWDHSPRYTTLGQEPNRPTNAPPPLHPVTGLPYTTVATRPGPSPLIVPGAVQGQVPTGYTSQPMSRDPSHQSSASGIGQSSGGASDHSPSPLSLSVQSVKGFSSSSPMLTGTSKPRPIVNTGKVAAGSPSSGMSNNSNPTVPGTNLNASGMGNRPSSMQLQMPLMPININATGSGAGRLPQKIQQQQQQHRPASYTETEPSPRMESACSGVDTRYSRWDQNQMHAYGHHQQGASASYQSPTAGDHVHKKLPTSTGPGTTATTASSTSAPHPQPAPTILWRNLGRGLTRRKTKERIQNVLGANSGRSQSVSPSAFPTRSRRGSGQHSGSGQQHPLASSATSTTTAGSATQGQEHARSPDLMASISNMGGQFPGTPASAVSIMPSTPAQQTTIGSLSAVASSPVTPAPGSIPLLQYQEQRSSSSPALGTGVGAGAGILLSDGTIFQFPSSSGVTSPFTPVTDVSTGSPVVGRPTGQEHGFPPPGSPVASGLAWELQQSRSRPMATPIQGGVMNAGLGTTPNTSSMGPPTMLPTPPTATGLGIARRKRIVHQLTSSSPGLQSPHPNPNTPPLNSSLPMLPSGTPLGSVPRTLTSPVPYVPASPRVPGANPNAGTSSPIPGAGIAITARGGVRGTRTRARSGSSPGPWRPSTMASMSMGSLHRPWSRGHGVSGTGSASLSRSDSPSAGRIDAGRGGSG
ncbi:uncharacterized protein B0T23DRAFT_399893 [Neurospora hispaniola]|uniref:DUF676 domain-containing protein n=1 Tax=Neurospora hispaniola TaxID=588809 RepID=A0AAJ0HZ75_9PEZI|nr:hypothetical protein B0T23DRAFT_399893 [Neurospora hispaniola]